MKATRKDITSYQRGEERIPRWWALELPGLTIKVGTGHRFCPDRWVMHCAPWYDTKDLGIDSTAPAEDAQSVALAMITAKIAAITEALQAKVRG